MRANNNEIWNRVYHRPLFCLEMRDKSHVYVKYDSRDWWRHTYYQTSKLLIPHALSTCRNLNSCNQKIHQLAFLQQHLIVIAKYRDNTNHARAILTRSQKCAQLSAFRQASAMCSKNPKIRAFCSRPTLQ